MKGLELSEGYFLHYGAPMIREKFAPYADRIAAGLVGDGSECYEFDDEISQDHDWGPGFCLWLTQDDFAATGMKLNEEIEKLPRTFGGFGPRQVSSWGGGRLGAMDISQFYQQFTGVASQPDNLTDWLFIPENALSTCTNGKVFSDPLGEFTRIREAFLLFYPEDVRLKKMASRCMTIAQSGQYNFMRCIKRKEFVAAHYAETKFFNDVISMVFLLNRKYTPYYKWMHRALNGLSELGDVVYERLNSLVLTMDYNEKYMIIEEICSMIIKRLRAHGLTDSSSDFLLDHGPKLQEKIINEELRQKNVWIG